MLISRHCSWQFREVYALHIILFSFLLEPKRVEEDVSRGDFSQKSCFSFKTKGGALFQNRNFAKPYSSMLTVRATHLKETIHNQKQVPAMNHKIYP